MPPLQIISVVCVLASALLATSCARIRLQGGGAPVTQIEFREMPASRPLAEHVDRFASNMYPMICDLLLDENAEPPKQFKVIFGRFQTDAQAFASSGWGRIYFNTRYDYWQRSDAAFEGVFTHEMAHIAMGFMQRRAGGVKWGESLADYARFKLSGTNGPFCPQCDLYRPTYEFGYTCGSAFLLFLENAYGTNLIKQLITMLTDFRYSEVFFVKHTGRTLDQLWADFRITTAFKPSARETLRVQQELGYKRNKPPFGVYTRFRHYVEQRTGREAEDIPYLRYKWSQRPPMHTLIEYYLCDSLPGGSPEMAWLDLRDANKVPGIKRGDTSYRLTALNYDDLATQKFPKSKTIKSARPSDSSIYNYTMVNDSPTNSWKLAKAWRTDKDGKVVEEYSVP